MGKTWDEIVKNAYEKGILLDGCGLDERYYWSGKYEDYCGFDILNAKCQCGYSKDWVNPSGNTGSGSTTIVAYYGMENYSDKPTIDDINEEDVGKLMKFDDNECSFTIEATPIVGLNTTLTDEEVDAAKKANAKTLLMAISKDSYPITISDAMGDVTSQWSVKEISVNGKIYEVYGSFDYNGQVKLYDSTDTKPNNAILTYAIKKE